MILTCSELVLVPGALGHVEAVGLMPYTLIRLVGRTVGVSVRNVVIGRQSYFDGGGTVPLSVFLEESQQRVISGLRLMTGQKISIEVENDSDVFPVKVKGWYFEVKHASTLPEMSAPTPLDLMRFR